MATATASKSTAASKKAPAKKATSKAPAKRAAKPTPPPHPLSHLVPQKWMGEDYIHRTFDGWTDIELFEAARKVRQNVLLYGETGPGKTSAVYAYAALNNIPLVNIGCNGAIDPSTLFVRPIIKTDNSVDLIETDVVTVIREGGILYFDEINFMPPRVASVMHGALDKRRTVTIIELGNESIKLHPNTQIIASYNPDYEGTKPLNEAFKNRFFMQLEYTYERDIEEQLVTSIPCLLDVADKLREAKSNGTIDTPCGPNKLIEFELICEMLSPEFAISNFVSTFHPEERSAVRKWVDHYRDDILAQSAEAYGEVDYEEDDDELTEDDTATTAAQEAAAAAM